jgi:tRNA G18 (ribose-2'-O)-methylase SpoU
MCGEISSLNASVSAAIVMYEVMNQRKDFKWKRNTI